MRAMVFGAGLGTRLRPLTELLPKPVVPFFDTPLSCWTLEHLAASGASSAVVNTHYDADKTEREIGAYVARSMAGRLRVSFSREATLLGTGGGLRRAWELEEREHGAMSDDEVLVAINGDILFAPDLSALVAMHRARRAVATMVLRRTEHPFALGAIEIAPDGRVVAMLAKDRVTEQGTPAMFTGVHVLSRSALARLPHEGCVVRQGYRRWQEEGLAVFGALSDAPWLDLGTPRVYRDAHLEVLRGARRLPGTKAGPDWIAASAVVGSGATIVESVVGAAATVAAGVRLERSVVWPGARVETDLADAIVLPDGRIVSVAE
ncbi:MAG: hypothetical protein K1X94_34895 [Sandaracinaceae bacterium]|nr:hypothetical protein [Sandaracinaceae bacterium]